MPLNLDAADSIPPTPPTPPAQEKSPLSKQLLLRTLRDVAIDPTTYVPSAITRKSEMDDWNTSQPLFQHGYVESNPLYTANGQPNSAPMSYNQGKNFIRTETLKNLGRSTANNALADVLSRYLINKYPDHSKLIKGLSWAEKIGSGAYYSYLGSHEHFAQAGKNRATAQQNGY